MYPLKRSLVEHRETLYPPSIAKDTYCKGNTLYAAHSEAFVTSVACTAYDLMEIHDDNDSFPITALPFPIVQLCTVKAS